MRGVVLLLAAVLVLVPTTEIAVILTVGSWLGAGWTLVLLLASAVIGSLLLRGQGRSALRALRDAREHGRQPTYEAAEGILVLLGGVLMVLPGFVTDLLGLVLVLPPTRRLGAAVLVRGLAQRLPPEVATELLGPLRVRSRRGPGHRRRRSPFGRRPGSPVPPGPPPRPAGESATGRVIDGETER